MRLGRIRVYRGHRPFISVKASSQKDLRIKVGEKKGFLSPLIKGVGMREGGHTQKGSHIPTPVSLIRMCP